MLRGDPSDRPSGRDGQLESDEVDVNTLSLVLPSFSRTDHPFIDPILVSTVPIKQLRTPSAADPLNPNPQPSERYLPSKSPSTQEPLLLVENPSGSQEAQVTELPPFAVRASLPSVQPTRTPHPVLIRTTRTKTTQWVVDLPTPWTLLPPPGLSPSALLPHRIRPLDLPLPPRLLPSSNSNSTTRNRSRKDQPIGSRLEPPNGSRWPTYPSLPSGGSA